MNKPFGVIYELIFPNGKRYIGQTITPLKVRVGHYKRLECEGQPKLYYALLKYGWDNVVCSVLYECDSMDELNTLEKITIDQYNTRDHSCGYNIREGGSNGKLSEETKKRISDAGKGRKHSEETRKKNK